MPAQSTGRLPEASPDTHCLQMKNKQCVELPLDSAPIAHRLAAINGVNINIAAGATIANTVLAINASGAGGLIATGAAGAKRIHVDGQGRQSRLGCRIGSWR